MDCPLEVLVSLSIDKGSPEYVLYICIKGIRRGMKVNPACWHGQETGLQLLLYLVQGYT